MRKLSASGILGLLFALMFILPLHAQTAFGPPGTTTTTSANTPPGSQAPDDVLKKLSDLVHAGKYAEAQRSVNALLTLYPGDKRLIKAKALLDKSFASSKPTDPAASASDTQLAGMDRVDYSALVVLARQAQQTDDLSEQKRLLHQFMDQSVVFLQKHPDHALLWQLRAASAISLDQPMAGYEAGQKLLTMGAADNNDADLLQLLGQLKNKGWLSKQRAEEAETHAKLDWILGTWGVREFGYNYEFSRSGLFIEGYYIRPDGVNAAKLGFKPAFKATILASGEVGWERMPNNVHEVQYWQSAVSCEIGELKKTMTITFPIWEKGKTEPDPQQMVLHFTRVGSTD